MDVPKVRASARRVTMHDAVIKTADPTILRKVCCIAPPPLSRPSPMLPSFVSMIGELSKRASRSARCGTAARQSHGGGKKIPSRDAAAKITTPGSRIRATHNKGPDLETAHDPRNQRDLQQPERRFRGGFLSDTSLICRLAEERPILKLVHFSVKGATGLSTSSYCA